MNCNYVKLNVTQDSNLAILNISLRFTTPWQAEKISSMKRSTALAGRCVSLDFFIQYWIFIPKSFGIHSRRSFFLFRYPKVTSNIPENERTRPINRRNVNRSFKNIAARINIKITLV